MNDRLPEDDKHRLPLRVTLQVDALCDEFESALDGPEVPLLAPFVDRVDPDGRTHLLEELVALAMEHLQKHGIKDAAGALLQANESLRVDLIPLIPDAEATALHSPSDANQPCVGRGFHVRCPHCHNPIELVPDGDLESIRCEACGSDFSLTSEEMETRAAREVTQIGHFKLVERIGMGAFGSVWKALDLELDRTVAVKIPRHGNLQQDAFLREARAAAQLHHPNIVPVHEVGRDGDSLYIISDFIRGITLADWLTGQQLTSREAAELCVKIAKALHYAHEHGVIHRDLKPGNIMIGEEGEPHLMDFGLARREAGEITMTLDGQVLGTPAYMSPEQAQGEAHTADRRSDIYSLGVMLFQLLTDELPFRGNARMLMHQVIHEEAPSPRRLNATVSKDLETITLKCLEKEPGRRYQTADALSADLIRYLSYEPIQARPIGNLEQVSRWCRRNFLVATLLGVVALTLVAGTGVSVYYAFEADKRFHESASERNRAIAALNKARSAVDDSFTAISEEELMNTPGMQALRDRLLGASVQYYEEFVSSQHNDQSLHAELAASYLRLTRMKATLGDTVESEKLNLKSIRLFKKLIGENLLSADYHIELANAYLMLGNLRSRTGRPNEAENNYHQGIKILVELTNTSPSNLECKESLAEAYGTLGFFLSKADRLAEADTCLLRSMNIWQDLVEYDQTVPGRQHNLAKVLNTYCLVQINTRQIEDATRSNQRATEIISTLVNENPKALRFKISLADCYDNSGFLQHYYSRNYAKSEQSYIQAIDIWENLVRENSLVPSYRSNLARSLHKLGHLQSTAGHTAKAEASHQRSIAIRKKLAIDYPTWGSFKRQLGTAYSSLAVFYGERNRDDDARDAWHNAVDSFLIGLQTEPEEPFAWYEAGIASLALGDVAEYRRICREMLSRFRATPDAGTAARIGYTCVAGPIAIEDARSLVRIVEHGGTIWKGRNERLLGASLYRAGRYQEAIDQFDLAVKNGWTLNGWDKAFLSMAHQKLGNSEQAREIISTLGKPAGYSLWYEQADIAHLISEATSLVGESKD